MCIAPSFPGFRPPTTRPPRAAPEPRRATRGAPEPDRSAPVELARIAIENSSRPGEIVVDPFIGGGGVLIAAEATGRRCFGIELDPRYVDLIIRRWETFTGQRARKEGETDAA